MGSSVKTGLQLCVVVMMLSINVDAFGGLSSQSRLFSDSAAMHAMQAAKSSCLISGAVEACQAAKLEREGKSDFFHVCPTDGDPCSPSECYHSTIPPCCQGSPLIDCISTSKVLVHGKTYDVSFYNVPQADITPVACFTSNPALEACDCKLDCLETVIVCRNNSVQCDDTTGVTVCECLPNYVPPHCCNCTAETAYRDTNGQCKPLCRDFCTSKLPGEGPCTSCTLQSDRVPPDCCNCKSGLTLINDVCRCAKNTIDDLGTCKAGYAQRNCCKCEEGLQEINGECRCRANTIDDGLGTCKPGYISPNCCRCEDGLTEINGECRCQGNTIDDGLGTCKAGYLSPNCCICEGGLNEINGECRCQGNTIGDSLGTCKAGYAPTNCCKCETGLTEINGECRCEQNTVDGTCKPGFISPNCCECAAGFIPDNNGQCVAPCSREQIVYFLLDATDSYHFRPFCEIMLTVQLLVAAFNPTTNGATKVSGYLIPNGANVWTSSDSCSNVVSNIIPDFYTNVRECLRRRPSSYPDTCGTKTEALDALRVILNDAENSASNLPQAVILLTDGILTVNGDLNPNHPEVNTTITNLNVAGVTTIVGAGLGREQDINRNILRQYVLPRDAPENVVIKENSAELGIAIVNRLEAAGILCKQHATDLKNLLRDLRDREGFDLGNYCRCVPEIGLCEGRNPEYITSYTYPTCGGPLNIDYSVGREPSQPQNLEEEIIAAVENVLERKMKG